MNKKELSIRFKLSSDFFFSVLLGLIWSSGTLVNYFKAVLLRLPYFKYVSDEIIMFAFLAVLLLALPYMLKKITPGVVVFYIVWCMVYLLNFVIYPQNSANLENNMIPFLVKSLPMIFVGMSINLKKHYSMLYYLSIVSVVLKFIQLMFDPVNFIYGDMHSSYMLLPHVCMVLLTALLNTNAVNILVSAIGIITILSFGTRGPVLCLLVLTAVCVVMFKQVKKHVLFYSASGTVFVLFVAFYDNVLKWLFGLIQRMGMSTRVLDILLYGNIFDSSGRNTIQATLLESIKSNWFGYGIAGDRTIVGTYTHNVIIEFWVSYGVIFGSILFIVPMVYTVKLLFQKRKRKNMEDGLILVLIASSFVKLLLSGSYLTEPFLFMLVGLVIAEYKRENSFLPCDNGNGGYLNDFDD